MKKTILLLPLLLTLLSGCSLIPKPVELFQKKVGEFPSVTESEKEYQRRVIKLEQERVHQVNDAAIADGAGNNIVVPAHDAVRLADALSSEVGPPKYPATDSDSAIQDLSHAKAKRDYRVDDFAAANEKVEGKKIEGTGLLQIPYFVWLGGFLIIAVIGWHLAKIVLTAATMTPQGAIAGSVGLGVMNVGSELAGKALTQVIAGGKKFLGSIGSVVDDPAVVAKIQELFAASHDSQQDSDVQTVVKTVNSSLNVK